jgi:hypothetical protein
MTLSPTFLNVGCRNMFLIMTFKENECVICAHQFTYIFNAYVWVQPDPQILSGSTLYFIEWNTKLVSHTNTNVRMKSKKYPVVVVPTWHGNRSHLRPIQKKKKYPLHFCRFFLLSFNFDCAWLGIRNSSTIWRTITRKFIYFQLLELLQTFFYSSGIRQHERLNKMEWMNL